jgi:Spy/CpxP family protein refolding chaperone
MRAALGAALLIAPFLAFPAQAEVAPYAGQDSRAVSSFSEADIAAIEAGEGWGLALPAELNGWPGPSHVLEMAEALGLEADQKARVAAIYAAMKAEAQVAGGRMIAAERALDAAFASGAIDRASLTLLLAEAGAARAALREVHLAAHLETTPLLTRHQRMLYAQARGYGGDHTGHGAQAGHGDHGGMN